MKKQIKFIALLLNKIIMLPMVLLMIITMPLGIIMYLKDDGDIKNAMRRTWRIAISWLN